MREQPQYVMENLDDTAVFFDVCKSLEGKYSFGEEAKERVTTHIAETSCKQSCCTVEGSSIRAIGMGNATEKSILVAKGQTKFIQSRLAARGGKKLQGKKLVWKIGDV